MHASLLYTGAFNTSSWEFYVKFVRNHVSLTSKSSICKILVLCPTWSTTSFLRGIFSLKWEIQVLFGESLFPRCSPWLHCWIPSVSKQWRILEEKGRSSPTAGRQESSWRCEDWRSANLWDFLPALCAPLAQVWRCPSPEQRRADPKGANLKENKDVVRPNISPCVIGNGHEITRSTMTAHWGSRDWKQP